MGLCDVAFGDTGVSLARVLKGNTVELAPLPVIVPAGTRVTIQVIAPEDSHTVSLNGEVTLEVNDPNPFPPSLIGLVNEWSEGPTGESDDLRVVAHSRLKVVPNVPVLDTPDHHANTVDPSFG
jgi:hypothetical protein